MQITTNRLPQSICSQECSQSTHIGAIAIQQLADTNIIAQYLSPKLTSDKMTRSQLKALMLRDTQYPALDIADITNKPIWTAREAANVLFDPSFIITSNIVSKLLAIDCRTLLSFLDELNDLARSLTAGLPDNRIQIITDYLVSDCMPAAVRQEAFLYKALDCRDAFLRYSYFRQGEDLCSQDKQSMTINKLLYTSEIRAARYDNNNEHRLDTIERYEKWLASHPDAPLQQGATAKCLVEHIDVLCKMGRVADAAPLLRELTLRKDKYATQFTFEIERFKRIIDSPQEAVAPGYNNQQQETQ